MRTRLASATSLAAALLLLGGCSSDDSSPASGWDGGHEAGTTSRDATDEPGDDAGVTPDATTGSDDGGTPPDAGPDATLDAPADAPFDGHDDGHDGSPDAAVGSADAGTDAAASDSGELADGPTNEDASGGDAGDAGADAASLPPLLGAWNFDEGTGTSSADLSGGGHPAVFAGGASWGTGKQGSGLALDGASGYADVGVTLIDTTSSFTVLAWVDFASVNAWAVAVSEDDVTGSLFGLKLRGDGTNQFDFDVETSDAMNPGFVVAQSTSTAQASSWVHLAGVYDASGKGALTVYVNGAPQATAAVGQPLLAASGHLLLGRGLYNGATGSFLHGTLDEVAVYGGALSDAQIAAIYAAQK